MSDLIIGERLGIEKVRRGFEFWSNNLSIQFISHSPGFIFSYLEIFPSKKTPWKELWWKSETYGLPKLLRYILRFALKMISCTTRAEMIRVASPWHIFRKSMKYELWSFEVLNRSFNLNFERWYFNIFHNRLEVHFSKTYIHENRGQHSSVDNFHFFDHYKYHWK